MSSLALAVLPGFVFGTPPTGASAVAEPPLHVPRVIDLTRDATARRRAHAATHELSLSLALIRGGGWTVDEVRAAAVAAVRILGQCGVGVRRMVLHEFEAPASYRVLWTPVSREWARRSALSRPAVFFVADTRHSPAFDAEAVGRANARTRPEMRDTVWIVAGARDLPVVIAHELVHVLTDSGAHSDRPGNLMRDETAVAATALTAAQCREVIVTGQANGLLRRSGQRPGRGDAVPFRAQ